MSSNGTVIFHGRSGESYRFQVWPLGPQFKSLAGVCLVSRRTYDNPNFQQTATHECLHIGQMSDLSRLQYDHPCFKDANCVCVYLARDEEHRLFVEDDLLQRFITWNAAFQVDLLRKTPSRSARPSVDETSAVESKELS